MLNNDSAGRPIIPPPHGSAKRPVLCYAVAHAAGADTANRQMRAAGRTTWNDADYSAAVAEFNRLMDVIGGGP